MHPDEVREMKSPQDALVEPNDHIEIPDPDKKLVYKRNMCATITILCYLTVRDRK